MRNSYIDGLKFLFSCLIALLHARLLVKNPDFGVHFFFIVSGYFLAVSVTANKYKNVIDYTKKHISRLAPQYYISIGALLLYYTLFIVVNKGTTDDIKLLFTRLIPELFFLQSSYIIPTYGVNFIDWYVSSIILNGILLFTMLTFYNRYKFLIKP